MLETHQPAAHRIRPEDLSGIWCRCFQFILINLPFWEYISASANPSKEPDKEVRDLKNPDQGIGNRGYASNICLVLNFHQKKQIRLKKQIGSKFSPRKFRMLLIPSGSLKKKKELL